MMAASRVLSGAVRRCSGSYQSLLHYASKSLPKPQVLLFANAPHNRQFHKTFLNFGEIVSFKLSDIGEGISEVAVKEWFVKEGDSVSQFDSLCEVQSDKASVTITSRYDGIIRKIHYEVEDMAKVGSSLVDIELIDEESSSSSSDEQVDQVQDQDATTTETVLSGGSSIDFFTSKPIATPAVRRMASEYDINLNDVKGTGKDGRVLKEDVLNFLDSLKTKADAQEGKKNDGRPAPSKILDKKLLTSFETAVTSSKLEIQRGTTDNVVGKTAVQNFDAKDKAVLIKGYKKAMVKTMSKTCSVPTFLYTDEVDVTELVSVRSMLKNRSEERGIKLSYMPFFIKAASLALKYYPDLNASVDENCEIMTYKAAHNIGVAMDTKNGLLVPNIKNVQHLTLLEIASELNRLQELGAKGQLGTADLSEGTFTLSNIGAIGGTYAKPVLLLPEVAIGAIGKIQVVPRFDANDTVVKRNILQVSWTADHRIIDGATVGRFSNAWKKFLEDPVSMTLEMR